MTTARSTTYSIAAHPNFDAGDFDYLAAKGWSEAEIVQRWDEELAAGKGPQKHAVAPDLVGFLAPGIELAAITRTHAIAAQLGVRLPR